MTCNENIRVLARFFKYCAGLGASLLMLAGWGFPAAVAADGAPVSVHWLDGKAPDAVQGVSWGVPWPRGTVPRTATFHVTNARGEELPSQSWPLAYWPDGSLKWTGNAVSVPAANDSDAKLMVAPDSGGRVPAAPSETLRVSQTSLAIKIYTGRMTCRIPKAGPVLIDSITRDDRVIAQQGRLVCQREDQSDFETKGVLREENFVSQIESVSLEQAGDVRAVVKIEGKHQAVTGRRAWIPFVVRLYFYVGVDTIRMVHTAIYDGDQNKDFIRGLGLRFSVPLREQAHNRHIRFAGETGMFAEPVRLLSGRRNPSPELYAKQIAGLPTGDLQDLPGGGLVSQMAAWDGFKQTQISPSSYSIKKRTGPHSAWIDASSGNRALGLAFVGDTSGGLAIGMKDFWQLAPTEFEIENAYSDTAEFTLWLWSPDSQPMDMRHYDTVPHGLEASYEDIEPDVSTSTATGVARTSEITICPFSQTPPNKDLMALARVNAEPPHLVCTPEYLHSVSTLGPGALSIDRRS